MVHNMLPVTAATGTGQKTGYAGTERISRLVILGQSVEHRYKENMSLNLLSVLK